MSGLDEEIRLFFQKDLMITSEAFLAALMPDSWIGDVVPLI